MNKKQNYCGYIAIIGQANVGKSTLINNLIGQEISIVTRKKNTTQKNIIGIKTQKNYQFIYIDTPGIAINHRNKYFQNIDDNNNNHKIQKSSLIIFIIDQIYWSNTDQIILNKIKKNNTPIILVINKIDKIKNKKILLPFINFLQKSMNFIEIVPISAKKIKNIILLNKIITPYLPKSSHLYPKNYITNNSQSFLVSEIIRQKLILLLGDEIPSILKVEIKKFHKKNKNFYFIDSVIWVNNIRQKKIVIGKHANKLKKIGTLSRYHIEKKMCIKIYLSLQVKEIRK